MRPSYLVTTRLATALTFALGCADEPAATGPGAEPSLSPPSMERMAVDRFTRREPFEEDITNPCTGGLIHFTGEIKEQVTSVAPEELLEQGLALHIEDQALLTGTGTDPVNGVTYTIRRTVHFGSESPTLEAPNFTNTFVTTVRGVTQGQEDNFLLHITFHLTVLPSGEVATEVVVESAECRG